MVKVTKEEIECDIDRKPGERYTISYPDGVKTLDRCPQHSKKLLSLKEEPGDWTPISADGRRGMQVLTAEEIQSRRTK